MEEKKKYTNPNIEIIMIESSDIVVTSEGDTPPVDPTNDDNQDLDEQDIVIWKRGILL